jgi:cell division protein FtsI/penicillin-binding protein 2
MAALCLVRLFFIQVVKSEYYRDKGDRQYLRPSTDLGNRGSILAQKKDGSLFALAGMKTAYLVTINPRLLASQASSTYLKLNSIIPLDPGDWSKWTVNSSSSYKEIATKVEPGKAEAIKALGIKGVTIYKQKLRSYPFGNSASQVVGLVGYKGDDLVGRYGLERQYEKVLSRQSEMSFANFFVEIFSGIGSSLSGKAASAEGNIVTTLEPVAQKFFEGELMKAEEEWQGDKIGGIIIDPKTGEIIAMAAWPNFDPGGKVTDLGVLTNPLVEGVYELGSIFKPLTMAAGLDTGVVTAKTTYNDKGCITLNKKKICNYDDKARGVIPMQEVLNQSLNCGASFVTQQLGQDRFRQYFNAYGFNEPTGVDLPGEATNLMKNLKSPRLVDYATASFGQGIAVTPLSLVRALSVLGNGGYLVTPHVVKEIDYQNKITQKFESKIVRQVIKKETSEEISRMLSVVVDEKMPKVKMERYSIAAKTGTAQIANPANGKYFEDRFLHSFFGYFPAYNPRFLVFIFIVSPKGAQFSSETLTTPFVNTSRFLLNYYQVAPDR